MSTFYKFIIISNIITSITFFQKQFYIETKKISPSHSQNTVKDDKKKSFDKIFTYVHKKQKNKCR